MKVLRVVFTDQLSKNNPSLADLSAKGFILFYEPMDTFYEILNDTAVRSMVSRQARYKRFGKFMFHSAEKYYCSSDYHQRHRNHSTHSEFTFKAPNK